VNSSRLLAEYGFVLGDEHGELPEVGFHLFDEVIISFELAPPELFSDHFQCGAVQAYVPPLPACQPHTALRLVCNLGKVVIHVDGSQLARINEALVLTSAVIVYKSIARCSEKIVVGDHEAGSLNKKSGLRLMFHTGMRLKVVAAAHRKSLESFVKWFSANSLYGQTECIIFRCIRPIADLLTIECARDDV